MMKLFLLFFFTILSYKATSQIAQYRLDSTVYHAQDSMGNNYRSAKNSYTYDIHNNCIEDYQTYLSNSTGQWTEGSKTYFYFDDKNNDTSTISTSYNAEEGRWITYNKNSETYDNLNRRTSLTQFNMDQKSGTWILVWKKEYTYDMQNRIISELFQDTLNASLKNAYKYEYEYTVSANNKYQYNWTTNEWMLSTLDEEILDPNGNVLRQTSYSLKNGTLNDPVWENITKYEHTYDSNNDRIETFAYNWAAKTWLGDDYQWMPNSYLLLTNDAYHNLIAWENFYWDRTTELFESQYKVERLYDTDISHHDLFIPRSFSNDNKHSPDFMYMLLEDKTLSKEGNNWKSGPPNKYYYSPTTITSTAVPLNIKSNIAVYPNPMSDLLNIKGKADIFDIKGNKVAYGENTIDVSSLTKGVYLVKTSLGNVKVIKE